jgi:K+/H+ antiporter YhaU regulatory subunit KhtT
LASGKKEPLDVKESLREELEELQAAERPAVEERERIQAAKESAREEAKAPRAAEGKMVWLQQAQGSEKGEMEGLQVLEVYFRENSEPHRRTFEVLRQAR